MKERGKLFKAQIALAEESARLRRKEKREKKRMEISKFLGINAWKCDQVNNCFHLEIRASVRFNMFVRFFPLSPFNGIQTRFTIKR